jgi:hypothetical protein
VKELLASSDPATLVGSLACVVFLLIYCVRRFAPKVWHAFEGHLAFLNAIQSDALWSFAWKATQAIPGTLAGAAIAAVASGGDLKKALLGALAGPVASIGHEVFKRYQGGASAALMLLLCLSLPSCASSQKEVCNPVDAVLLTAQYSKNVLIKCEGYTFEDCPALPGIEAEYKAALESSCPR